MLAFRTKWLSKSTNQLRTGFGPPHFYNSNASYARFPLNENANLFKIQQENSRDLSFFKNFGLASETDTLIKISSKIKRDDPQKIEQPIGDDSNLPGTKAVVTAIGTNALVSAAKIIAFVWTGSGSMLSEAVHSLADTANQVLLYIGIQRSNRAPTKDHPYGYGSEQFVWALISAVSVFFIGSGCTIYHGISTLIHPHSVESIGVALSVLSLSLVLEGYTLAVAVNECRKGAAELGMSFRDYIIKGPDPMNVAVLLEDAAAVMGVSIAASCVGLTYLTGNLIFDSIGSIAVGSILGMVALFLIRKNKDSLVGRSIPRDQQEKILTLMKLDPVITSVRDVKAVSIGSNILRFQADVNFNGEEISKKYLLKTNPDVVALSQELNSPEKLQAFLLKYGDGVIDQLGREVDRIEEEIRIQVPEAQFVDLETDTKLARQSQSNTSN